MDRSINKFTVIVLITLYTASFGIMLLNNGIFWDDWVIYNVNIDSILESSHQLGLWLLGPYLASIINLKHSIFIFRIICFLSYLIAALSFYGVLKTVKEVSPLSRFFIILFFALFPVNYARIAISVSHYAVSYALFFGGFWLLSRHVITHKLIFRILGLIFFFISFTTSSLLVLYMVVLGYLFYIGEDNGLDIRFSFKSIFRRLFIYLDFLVLPVIYWVIKSIFFVPYGEYLGYNQFEPAGILLSPIGALYVFLNSFVEAFNFPLTLISGTAIFWAITLACILYRHKNDTLENNLTVNRLFMIGIFAFFIGVFPYIAVMKFPSFGSCWDTRHQMLIPLGAGFILFFGLKMFLNKIQIHHNFYIFIYSLLVMIFVHANFSYYFTYQKDWFKQLALVENFKESRVIKEHTTFLFEDYSKLNAFGRDYRFYEYTGLMKYAFGDQKRFGINSDKYTKITDYQGSFTDRYNMKDYKPIAPEYKVLINRGSYSLDLEKNIYSLIVLEKTDPTKFKTRIKNILSLKIIPINPI